MARYKTIEREVTKESGKPDKVVEKSCSFEKESKEFAFMFFDDIRRMLGLKEVQIKLLYIMAKHMDHQNVVRISGQDRKDWAYMMGVSYQTLNLAISKLMEHGVVLRQSLGSYIIDPEIFNKGAIRDLNEKVSKFNAHFHVTYEKKNDGFTRVIKVLRDVSDDSNHDPDTGEVY